MVLILLNNLDDAISTADDDIDGWAIEYTNTGITSNENCHAECNVFHISIIVV